MARVAPKIPFALLSGGDPQLNISDDDWRRIEDVYGSKLSTEVREQIYTATITFLLFVEGEQTAQSVSAAQARVDNIKKAAKRLYGVICESGQAGEQFARDYANYLVEQHFGQPIATLMISLEDACNCAAQELSDPENQRRKGRVWDDWVRELIAILGPKNLPTQVRKDDLAQDRPSAFVRLVCELQRLLPPGVRRPAHSLRALTEAIDGARVK